MGFKVDWGLVGKTGVESGAVIKDFDVIEDGSASLGESGEVVMIDQFVFEAAKEAIRAPLLYRWARPKRVKGLHKQRREITSLRRVLPSIDLEKILQRVAKKYGVDRQRLVARGERRLQAKNVAMWIAIRSRVKWAPHASKNS